MTESEFRYLDRLIGQRRHRLRQALVKELRAGTKEVTVLHARRSQDASTPPPPRVALCEGWA